MHKLTHRFKTYTQLEKTYRKILVRRLPAQHGRPRTEFRRTRLLPLTRQYSCEMGKSEPLILLRQDT